MLFILLMSSLMVPGSVTIVPIFILIRLALQPAMQQRLGGGVVADVEVQFAQRLEHLGRGGGICLESTIRWKATGGSRT